MTFGLIVSLVQVVMSLDKAWLLVKMRSNFEEARIISGSFSNGFQSLNTFGS